jgi:hypothetical protein
MCLRNKKIKNFIGSLDIFEVDSVQIQYEKASTKSLFGGILTLMIPLCCILAFVLLFLSNQSKPTITTQTLSNTNSKLSSPLQATIEWNKDLVDISTINPIQVVTNGGKTSSCYQNKGNFTTTEIPLCDFSNDLIGEPNGLGYVFKLKSPNQLLPILPFKTSDIIAFHEKDQATYILHVLENKFCVYKPRLTYTDSFCVPFLVIIKADLITFVRFLYRNGNDIYYSLDNNFGTLYLFKNHNLVSSRPCPDGCKMVYISENMIAERVSKNFWYLNTTNTSVSIYREPYPKLTFISFIAYIYEKLAYVYLSAGSIPHSFNLTLITYTTTNSTKEVFSVPPLAFDYSKMQLDMKLIDNTMYTLFYKNGICKLCYTHVCALDIITKELKCKTFFANYTDHVKTIHRVSMIPKHGTNGCYIIDQEIDNNNDVSIKSFMVFDSTLEEDYLPDPTNSYNSLVSNIYMVQKINKNYLLTFRVSYFPSSYNNFDSVNNFGGVLECSPSKLPGKLQTCVSLYSNSFTIQPNPKLDLTQTVATLKIGNNNIKLTIQDVISQKDFQNSYQIHNIRLSNVDNIYKTSNYLKTLYSISIQNENMINLSYVPFSSYFKADNNKTGYDKKFTCYIIPYDNAVDTIGNVFAVNSVSCAPPTVQHIPFIFDNAFHVYSNGLKGNYVNSTDLTGVFLVHLDPVIIETTVVSTKAEIATILANVMSVFTTLLTVFMTVKKFAYKKDNKYELAKKMLELAPSETSDNIEISVMSTDDQIELNKKLAELRSQNIV